jgi:hypothetical protein
LGSGISYRNVLGFTYLVLLASLFLRSAETSGQNVLQYAGSSDTTRSSALKLKDESGIPWESKQKSPLFLNNPSNYKSTNIYFTRKLVPLITAHLCI